LLGGAYAALVQVLADRELIRTAPFDAAPSPNATFADLDEEKMRRFIREARRARGFPLQEGASPEELLIHLNLLDRGQLLNAAVLLFGVQPQRFLGSSEVKCAHFHGTLVAKPIPSYQVYKGTAFDLVDQAVDFLLIAESLYLTRYIERMGTGIEDMIRRCREAGLPEPAFAITDGFVNTVRRKPESSTLPGKRFNWMIESDIGDLLMSWENICGSSLLEMEKLSITLFQMEIIRRRYYETELLS
jgi:predicted HTH transcriptional regulator